MLQLRNWFSNLLSLNTEKLPAFNSARSSGINLGQIFVSHIGAWRPQNFLCRDNI